MVSIAPNAAASSVTSAAGAPTEAASRHVPNRGKNGFMAAQSALERRAKKARALKRPSLLFPAATQRLVQLHQVHGAGKSRDDQRALRVVHVALGDQRPQVAIHSAPVTHVGEPVAGLG